MLAGMKLVRCMTIVKGDSLMPGIRLITQLKCHLTVTPEGAPLPLNLKRK
jgi:hypothetical protein